jgi:CheY-like chemotaxis protein
MRQTHTLINAAQAIPEGHADENEIRVSTATDDLGRVLIEFSDTGPGIAPELREKLFTPFVTTKPRGVGTGLGLAICQRIVTMLDGEISFESEMGRGTVFRVVLQPESEATTDPTPLSHTAVATRRGRVLVIDDDPILRALMGKTLGEDHDVVCAVDGRHALELLVGTSFDVILCDLMMPRMTGVEFYAELERVRPELAACTIFITGGAFTPDACDFLEGAAGRCLEKPIELGALRALVNDRIA